MTKNEQNGKILIVEDDPSIQTLLQYNLKQAGFHTVLATDGEDALHLVETESPSLILLDIMLPKIDGIQVCRTLREQDVQIPIIMLTAKSSEMHKIEGLNIGADDYMTKPFSPQEVIARIHAVLRRTERHFQQSSKQIVAGPIEINIEQYVATINGELLELTPKEFELLLYFIQNEKNVLSREELLQAVWNYDFVGDTRIVDVHVSHLRDKIEDDKKNPQFIKTIRGIGYKFEGVQ